MAECPTCGRESTAGAQFCSACGTALGVPASEEVRKTVTVVFCDLVGSTSLGEQLDPESTRRVIGRYFDEARVAIERHGGTVEKFIGDAVMSVFGIPRLHEDDALRAVRAAAELRDAVAELGDELESELGVRIEVRIGVATGEVVAGDHSSGQAFVTGDVVNVAARYEQAAGPGEILLGERTRELVGDAVRVEAAGPLTLKGKSAPVAAWRLLGLVDAPAVLRAVDAPFVGRERELAALWEALQRAVEARSCQLCTVVGPPGIGKSRLVEEFAAAAADRHRVVAGSCLEYGDGITYWPLAEIVQQGTGGAQVEDVLGGVDDAALVAERIAGAIGTAEPWGAPEEIFWAFRRLFEALARDQPLIVVVDELQWAEATLLDLLEYLLTFAAGVPILLLGLARPELFDERPTWAAPRRAATVITLEPLAETDSATIVETLTATRGLQTVDLARIVAAAEGNPLFLEQLLAYRGGNGDGEGALAIPPTIQALLAARIDRLTADERAVILRAAVEGKTFHRGALAGLLPEPARPALGARLMSLVRQELIRPDRSQFAGDDAFRFGHSLIHEAAYEAAPKNLRADAHEHVAGWLEGRADEHTIQYEEIVGYHLEQAHRYRAELGQSDATLAGRAVERLDRAGRRALDRGDIPAALNLLERSLALADAADVSSSGVRYSLGIARMESGDLEGADAAFTVAIERAEKDGDPLLATRATLERSRLRLLTGRATPDELEAQAKRAVPVFERLGDDAGLARAWLQLVDVHGFRSEMAATEQAAEQARLHARRAGDVSGEADAMFWGATGALYGERPVAEGLALCRRLLAESNGPMADVGVLEILAALSMRNGDVADGRELYRRGDTIYRELGMRFRAAINLQCRGTAELAIGEFETAEEVLCQAIDELEEAGERGVSSTAAALLAHALCAQGDYEAAAGAVEASEQRTSPDDVWNQALIPSARARIVAAQGELQPALDLAHRAVTAAAPLDAPEIRAQALVSLAEVLRSADRSPEEAATLREALDLYERKGIRPAAERVRDRLAKLAALPAP
jgi:class 3 adenylate cyclase/tetratricopeptide (TPR) repeat protein